MTTLQTIRDIISHNKEFFDRETTLEDVLDGGYLFPTSNKNTIIRTFYLVQDELKLISETEARVKKEYHMASFSLAITFFILGLVVGKFLI